MLFAFFEGAGSNGFIGSPVMVRNTLHKLTRERSWSEGAGALVELTLFLPVAFLLLIGTLTSTELIQSASEASQLSREIGNVALRQCAGLLEPALSTCLSSSAESVLSLRPSGARDAQAIVSAYRCPSFTCSESSGLPCPVLSSSCQCQCPGAAYELVGQGNSPSQPGFSSRYNPARIGGSEHLATLFQIKGFLIISEVRVKYRDSASQINPLGAYEASFL